jgi:hypothetical protein
LTYNGCVLADSVGLGKTYSALAVIKYFELRNERVLVLCPKKLRENWTVYRQNDQLNPFIADRFRYDVLSHTDLSRDSGFTGDMNLATINWGAYDLVVIDESHNFRNNTPGPPRRARRDRAAQPLCAADGGHHPGRRADQGAAAVGDAGQQRPQRSAQPALLHHRQRRRRLAAPPSASPASRRRCARRRDSSPPGPSSRRSSAARATCSTASAPISSSCSTR